MREWEGLGEISGADLEYQLQNKWRLRVWLEDQEGECCGRKQQSNLMGKEGENGLECRGAGALRTK